MGDNRISEVHRNSRTALYGYMIEALIVVAFYTARFLRGERAFCIP